MEISEAVKLATEAGYDVTIKATPTKDGRPGKITMPIGRDYSERCMTPCSCVPAEEMAPASE